MAAVRSFAPTGLEGLDELELRAVWGELERREFGYAFLRCEERTSRLPERYCDCGHTIGASEPYRYTVGKLAGAAGIFQISECDVCKRRGCKY